MIRANLLPRSKNIVSLFGRAIRLEHVRQSIAGIALASIVTGIGIGIERLRIDRYEHLLAIERRAIAARLPELERAEALATDLARFQEFAHLEAAYRRSGAEAATEVAAIGNDIPPGMWLDSLVTDRAGYAMAGSAERVRTIGTAVGTLRRNRFVDGSSLLTIETRRPTRNDYRFTAHVGLGPDR